MHQNTSWVLGNKGTKEQSHENQKLPRRKFDVDFPPPTRLMFLEKFFTKIKYNHTGLKLSHTTCGCLWRTTKPSSCSTTLSLPRPPPPPAASFPPCSSAYGSHRNEFKPYEMRDANVVRYRDVDSSTGASIPPSKKRSVHCTNMHMQLSI